MHMLPTNNPIFKHIEDLLDLSEILNNVSKA